MVSMLFHSYLLQAVVCSSLQIPSGEFGRCYFLLGSYLMVMGCLNSFAFIGIDDVSMVYQNILYSKCHWQVNLDVAVRFK